MLHIRSVTIKIPSRYGEWKQFFHEELNRAETIQQKDRYTKNEVNAKRVNFVSQLCVRRKHVKEVSKERTDVPRLDRNAFPLLTTFLYNLSVSQTNFLYEIFFTTLSPIVHPRKSDSISKKSRTLREIVPVRFILCGFSRIHFPFVYGILNIPTLLVKDSIYRILIRFQLEDVYVFPSPLWRFVRA